MLQRWARIGNLIVYSMFNTYQVLGENKPQMKSPRATPLEGVSTYEKAASSRLR